MTNRSKYSIAFLKAKNKCGTVVQFNDDNTVKLEYTDQNYENPTDNPKVPPYPNIGDNPPDEDYLTGQEYVELGGGKKLEDLPQCMPTPLRIDILPSLVKMGLNETVDFKAFVFGSDITQEIRQDVQWKSEHGEFETKDYIERGITLAKIGTFQPHENTTVERIKVIAELTSDSSIYGEAEVILIHES